MHKRSERVSVDADGNEIKKKKENNNNKSPRTFQREGALAIWTFWIIQLRAKLGHCLPDGDSMVPRDYGYLRSFIKFLGTAAAVKDLLDFVLTNWKSIRTKYPRAAQQEVPNFFIIDCLKEELVAAMAGTVNIDKNINVGGTRRSAGIRELSAEERRKYYEEDK